MSQKGALSRPGEFLALLLCMSLVGCAESKQRHLERTTVFVAPKSGCEIAYEMYHGPGGNELFAMVDWFPEPTKNGDTGIFYWDCGD